MSEIADLQLANHQLRLFVEAFIWLGVDAKEFLYEAQPSEAKERLEGRLNELLEAVARWEEDPGDSRLQEFYQQLRENSDVERLQALLRRYRQPRPV
jgi:hypothetical protein